MQMNMIAVDRENKISPAKGSKVQHFYPLQLTTGGRRQTGIPFYTVTRKKELHSANLAAWVAIQLHIASLVTTGNALRETRL